MSLGSVSIRREYRRRENPNKRLAVTVNVAGPSEKEDHWIRRRLPSPAPLQAGLPHPTEVAITWRSDPDLLQPQRPELSTAKGSTSMVTRAEPPGLGHRPPVGCGHRVREHRQTRRMGALVVKAIKARHTRGSCSARSPPAGTASPARRCDARSIHDGLKSGRFASWKLFTATNIRQQATDLH